MLAQGESRDIRRVGGLRIPSWRRPRRNFERSCATGEKKLFSAEILRSVRQASPKMIIGGLLQAKKCPPFLEEG